MVFTNHNNSVPFRYPVTVEANPRPLCANKTRTCALALPRPAACRRTCASVPSLLRSASVCSLSLVLPVLAFGHLKTSGRSPLVRSCRDCRLVVQSANRGFQRVCTSCGAITSVAGGDLSLLGIPPHPALTRGARWGCEFVWLLSSCKR